MSPKPEFQPNGIEYAASCDGRVYANTGNVDLLELIPPEAKCILDVGCGAGDNARILAGRGHRVWGLTLSSGEAHSARAVCEAVWVSDLEEGLPSDLPSQFDAILFSHVLEHLRRPVQALFSLMPYLKPGGLVFAAVPNMAHWRLRLQFLKGDWTRPHDGPMDSTHLQFWSFHSFRDLFQDLPLQIVRHTGAFSVPLFPLRRAAPRVARWLDDKVGSRIPNFSAGQTLIVARKLG